MLKRLAFSMNPESLRNKSSFSQPRSFCALPLLAVRGLTQRQLRGSDDQFGGSYGEGEMIKGPKVVDYYNSVTGSWGLQAGAQSYAYVVFLMTDDAVRYVENTKGWELGVGPAIVAVDEGVAKNLSTSSLKDDAYAFIFSQEGLMAGVSTEGTKITRIER
jgi:lipid-binding SYLF domain-containing protein